MSASLRDHFDAWLIADAMHQFEYFTVWVNVDGTSTKFPSRFTRPDVVLETVRRLNEEEEEQEERQGYCEGRYYVWSEPAGERTRV